MANTRRLPARPGWFAVATTGPVEITPTTSLSYAVTERGRPPAYPDGPVVAGGVTYKRTLERDERLWVLMPTGFAYVYAETPVRNPGDDADDDTVVPTAPGGATPPPVVVNPGSGGTGGSGDGTPTADTTSPVITGPSTVTTTDGTTTIAGYTSSEPVTWSVAGADAAVVTIPPGPSMSAAAAFRSPRSFAAPGDAGANNVYDFTILGTDANGNVGSRTVSARVVDPGASFGGTGGQGLLWDNVDQTAATVTVGGRDWKFNTPLLPRNFQRLRNFPDITRFYIVDGDIRRGDPLDRHRSELSGSGFPFVGPTETWVAWCMMPVQLPANWWTSMFQFFDTRAGGTGWPGPIIKIEDRSGTLTEVNIAGTMSGNRVQVPAWHGDRFVVGRRYHMVMRIVAHGQYGELDWWVNGTLILSLRNVPIGQTATPSAYFKYGIYADDNNEPMNDDELIYGPMEIAQGVNALQARIAAPTALPGDLATRFPLGLVLTGTKLITDGAPPAGGTLPPPPASSANLFDTILPTLGSNDGTGTFTYDPATDTLSLAGTGVSTGAYADWRIPTIAGRTYRVRGTISGTGMNSRVGTTVGGADIVAIVARPNGAMDFSWAGTGAVHHLRFNRQAATPTSVNSGMSLIET